MKSLEKIVEIAAIAKLDALQLHGEETPEFVRELKAKTNLEIIKAFRVSPEFKPEDVLQYEDGRDFARRLFAERTRRNGRNFRLGNCEESSGNFSENVSRGRAFTGQYCKCDFSGKTFCR